jgi:predicted membrane-bound spermidine synthase
MNAARRPHPGVFFLLFTVSGFAGLIYESIWSHYLKLFLGHAAYAQTLVLAIFMGGMAVGAWLVSRFTHRIANLLLGYAIAELCIGAMALAFHGVFQAATAWAFTSVLPALGGSGMVDAFKWTLASSMILPASVLLGTTFPLMSGGIIRTYPGSSGRALSMLYFTNSFGAAAGVLASGFYLIDHVGLPGAILTAGLMNVALALVVWVLVRRMPVAAPVAPEISPSAGPVAGRFGTVILAVAVATGAASFIYEITWIRMLSLGLGASTHSFEVMLAAFILGMSMGAFWLRNRLQDIRDHPAWLAAVLLAKAMFAVGAIWVYAEVLEFIAWMMHATAKSDAGYTLTTLAGLLASMAVMFPTAFCAGMTLPLATHALTSRGHGEAAIGRVYGANTAGCIVGTAFATHIGMEALGVKGLTGMGALLDAGVACLVLLAAGTLRGRRPAAIALGVALATGVALFATSSLDLLRMASGVFRYGAFVNPAEGKVAFYRDGKTATISVVDVGKLRTIRTNGKPDAGVEFDTARPVTEDEPTMALLAALPLAAKPQAKLAANIGFGSGLTTHGLLGSPRLERVDTIEIEPAMVEAARTFQPRNARAYADRRSHIHIEDAKTFFAAQGTRYDVIVSEPSNPWVSGVSTLFSQEFYGQVKRHLAPDGVLVQWIHAYELDFTLLASIFKALGTHFPDYAVYAWSPGDLYVVASAGPKLPKLSAEVFSFPDVAADLRRLGIESLQDIEALRIGGKPVLGPLFDFGAAPANSDYFPILDQRAPRARYRGDQVFELREMRDALEPVLPLLDGESRTPRERVHSGGRTQPPRITRAFAGIEALAVMQGASAGQTAHLSGARRANAIAANALASGCKGSEALWLNAVTDVIHTAVPNLEASVIAPAFAWIRKTSCWSSLDEAHRSRIDLLEAINARDAAAIARLSTRLLETPGVGEGERAYLAVNAVAALSALGERAKAREVVQRQAPALSARDRERLLVRTAFAAAFEGPR